MFKKSKLTLLILMLMLVFGIVLAACSDSTSDENNDNNDEETEETGNNGSDNNDEEDTASGEPQMGGNLVGAMDTAPAGVFNPIFYEEAYEANILDFTHEGLLTQDESMEFIAHLAHDWEINDDQTEITLYIEENVKWHDGEDFTADDVVFTYKSIASPGYVEAGGVRTEYVDKLVGYEDFVNGETDEFVGVVAEDDYTVTFKYEQPNVTILKDVGFPIIPEHVFADVPIEEMPEHTATLDPGEVIGTGPFMFTEMLEREQYVLEKHVDYWQGEPYLDSVTWRIVDQSVMLGLLENGEIDFIGDPSGVPAADYDEVAQHDHINIIEQADFGYQLMGFIHNHRTDADAESGEINPDNWIPNEDMNNQLVRQAIAYTIDRQGIVDELLYGHGSVIHAPIAQQFWAYNDSNATKYEEDLDKANELLDEAGYLDVNDDGWRETPEGEEWIVNLNYPTGNKLREDSAPLLKQMIERAGIQVDVRQPKEMSAYTPELTDNNSDWDLYLIGWSLGSGDPDPSGLWRTQDAYNFGRWNNAESDQLILDALTPPDAFEQSYREEVYAEWQGLFSEDLPALLLYAQNSIYGINERVNGIEPMPYGFNNDPHLWWVTETE